MSSRLEVRELRLRFGGVTALDGATLGAEPGYVTGLIGPNGAGKTTLFDVVVGLRAAGSGTVLLDGTRIDTLAPHARARRGIARTFQRLELFWSLTARDNVRVAAETRARWSGSRARRSPDELLRRVGAADIADVRVSLLPVGLARLVELARALATEPRVLLLDEPSSGLQPVESEALEATLRSVAGDGPAVLVVEHDIPLVMRLCAHVHVLNAGRVIASGPPAQVQSDARVQAAYLGTPAGPAVWGVTT